MLPLAAAYLKGGMAGVRMTIRLRRGHCFVVTAVAALLWSAPPTVASTTVADREAPETHCASERPTVPTFYAELNAGAARDIKRLAEKGEAAAAVLISCADSNTTAPAIDRDRLRVRAADALFIAAEARSRVAQHRRQVLDLNRVVRLVTELDPAGRSSNEHLYQEARLLQRFCERIIAKARP